MIPTGFDQQNTVFGPPDGLTEDDVSSVNAFVGEHPDGSSVVITCWKPTQQEFEDMKRTGRVWLYCFGSGMAPVAVSGHNPWEKVTDGQQQEERKS